MVEELRATALSLVKQWSEEKGFDPNHVLMAAGAATMIGKVRGTKNNGPEKQ